MAVFLYEKELFFARLCAKLQKERGMTMDFMPQLMISNDGRPVTDAAAMALRRKELLEILQTHAYGAPIPPVCVSGRVVGTDRH